MEEFLDAVKGVGRIDPRCCRQAVERENGLAIAYPRYMRYFRRLQKLLGQSWYETGRTWRGPEIVKVLGELGMQPLSGAEVGVDRGELSSYLLRACRN